MRHLNSDCGAAGIAVPSRLPIHFFAIAIFFFALGTATAPWAAVRLADYFYQLAVLAWVHTFTLGWITAAIFGLIYCYFPGSGRSGLRFPRLAALQLVLYFLGASGVIAHFMLGSWDGVWMAGGVMALSVILFAFNALPSIGPRFGRGTAETGLLLGLCFLLCASCLGAMLALDKQRSFIPGTLMSNLSAHAHLAVIGWAAIAVCGLSYRMTGNASEAPGTKPPAQRAAIAQLFGLAIAAIALFAALIAGSAQAAVWSVLTAAMLLGFGVLFQKNIRSFDRPQDWTARHSVAALLSLLMALIAGMFLAAVGAGSVLGARVVCAYGVLGLLGFVSNFLIALSYTFFSDSVARVRAAMGWPHLSRGDLSYGAERPLVFWSFNGGVLLMAAGLLGGEIDAARLGGVLIGAGGVVYSAAAAWTLSFAYRRAAPAAPDRWLRAAQD